MTDKMLQEAVIEASDLILDTLKEHGIPPGTAAMGMTKTLVSMLFMISENYQDAIRGAEAVFKSMEADLQVLYDRFAEEKLTAKSAEELQNLIQAKAARDNFKI